MSYLVLARKWRPKTFAEVVGQPVVTRTLQNAVSQGRVAQAYLFSGMRGVGKTTMARILAKALNCESGPAHGPCDACGPCREIASGRSLDVVEMDAASNRGIDDIRRLQETLLYRGSLRHKVVTLDEAHMLTKEANNAFLKTLEEPPPGVLFVLATTEPHKIEETVLSRCQHFSFRRIDEAEIAKHLRHIAEAEKIKISDTALDLVVRESEGSMRDAIVSLDQLLAFVGTDISDADAATVLGTIEREVLHALMGAVVKEDSSEILTLVQRLASEGVNLERLMVELVWYLRELLVVKAVSEPKEFLRLSERDLEKMKAMASFLSEADLLRALELVARAERELRWSRQPRFLVEATLLKLAHLKRLTSIEEAIERLQGDSSPQGSGGSVEEEFKKLSAPPAKPKALFQNPGESNSPSAVKTAKAPAGADLPRPVADPPAKAENPAALSVTSLTPVKTTLREAPSSEPSEDRTQKLIAHIEKERPSLAGALSLASRWDWSDGTLTLRFTPRHGAIRENLEKTHKAELQECLKETLGQSYELRFLSLDPSDKDIEAFAGLKDKKIQEEHLLEEAMQEPLVRRVLDLFKGRVVEVEKLEK